MKIEAAFQTLADRTKWTRQNLKSGMRRIPLLINVNVFTHKYKTDCMHLLGRFTKFNFPDSYHTNIIIREPQQKY